MRAVSGSVIFTTRRATSRTSSCFDSCWSLIRAESVFQKSTLSTTFASVGQFLFDFDSTYLLTNLHLAGLCKKKYGAAIDIAVPGAHFVMYVVQATQHRTAYRCHFLIWQFPPWRPVALWDRALACLRRCCSPRKLTAGCLRKT
jgi:hypothetical protein